MDISKFTENLNEKIALDINRYKVINRENIIKRIRVILNQDGQSSAILVGEPGVGKTAIIEGLAAYILEADESDPLFGKIILKLDLSRINGKSEDADYAFQFGQLIEEIAVNRDKYILFIDEAHQIVGTGASEGSMQDVGNLLKPAIGRGEIQVVGATTIDEYHRSIEKDGALQRRLEEVDVPEFTPEETISVLKDTRWRFTRKHNVDISIEMVKQTVDFATRFISDKFFPDKALALLASASSTAEYNQHTELQPSDLIEVVHEKFNIPVSVLSEGVSSRLLKLEKRLKSRVIGQDEALETIVNRIWSRSAGLGDMSKPISFFLAGTTGVGKTETAKALAEGMFGSESNMIRLDMSEYKIPERAVPKFKTMLSSKVKSNPYSVLLLDEIDKADAEVLDILLQILDDGRLTDDYGRQINFKDLIILMTSNINADMVLKRDSKSEQYRTDERRYKTFISEFKNAMQTAGFRPEFISRLGNIIIYHPLIGDDIKKIVEMKLDKLNVQAKKQGFQILYKNKDLINYIPTIDEGYELNDEGKKIKSSSLVEFLLDKGYELSQGVRPLDEVINKYVETYLSNAIMTQRVMHKENVNTFLFRAFGEGPQKDRPYGNWEIAVSSIFEPQLTEGGS